MEDWKKIRKSDDEFLKEIYECANRYQEDCEKKSERNEAVIPFEKKRSGIRKGISYGLTAAAAGVLVLLGGSRIITDRVKDSAGESPEVTLYRSVDESQFENQESVLAPEEALAFEVKGEITGVEEDDTKIVLKIAVSESENKDITGDIDVVIGDDFYEHLKMYQEDYGISSLKGQKVQLSIESYNWQEYYVLNQEELFYLETINEDGTRSYRKIEDDGMNN